MVRVKGGEWGHVSVVKEPAKHGMAWHVKCSHCSKVFQGNAMRIRSHLLGHPEKVSGCPACPPEAREALRLSYLAKAQVERKRRQSRSARAPIPASRGHEEEQEQGPQEQTPQTQQQPQRDAEGANGAAQQALRSMVVLAREFPGKFANLAPFKAMIPNGDLADLEFFLDGFGIRAETITKIKEMGFTGKTFMSNVDELLTLLASIKQHCHLTLGEEWGIKGAAKKWQKEHGIANSQTELDKWPDSETQSAAPECKEEILNLP